MRILIVNGHLHVGGVEKSLLNLLKTVDYSQHQVDLLLVEDLGEYYNEIPPEVRIIYFDLKPTYGSMKNVLLQAIREKNFALAYQKIILTLANKISKRCLPGLIIPKEIQKSYDCAIAYRVGMPLDLVSYVIDAKIKCAWWHHGAFDYSNKEVCAWNYAFNYIDHIVCVSNASRKMIEPFFQGMRSKMCVIPNMIIPEEIQKMANEFNPYENIIGARILVSVGRLSVEKHMADAIDAMRQLLLKGYDNVIWYLLGDGPEREVIEHRIQAYELQNRIRLIGSQANPYPYIKNADVFVHPSWIESQGICVLEAMALRKVCVVVRSEGTDEFVVDNYNAIQSEQTIDSLTEAIEEALASNEIDLNAGQGLTVDKYTPEAIWPEINKLFTETIHE